MLRAIGLAGKDASFKKLKKHKVGSNRYRLSQATLKTLGSGGLYDAVLLPRGETTNEWLAVNTVDFFNELAILYGLIADAAEQRYTEVGQGFPPGFQYLWADGVVVKKPIKCSSPDYVDYVMTWVEGMLSNEAIFPSSEDVPFPRTFRNHICVIMKRFFRVFTIIYSKLLDAMKEKGADKHLNTCFKHFLYFAAHYDLLTNHRTEFRALPEPTGKYVKEYRAQAAASNATAS